MMGAERDKWIRRNEKMVGMGGDAVRRRTRNDEQINDNRNTAEKNAMRKTTPHPSCPA
jgi:hypothetical protein